MQKMSSVNKSMKDVISNEHDKKNTVLENEENLSLNIISNDTSLDNRKRYIGQSSKSNTPTSPNQTPNESDQKMESSLTNNDESSNQPKKNVS